MVVGKERVLQLAEVLDDAVQDDRHLVLDAAGQRVCVLVGDLAVRGPARVANARRGLRPVEPGRRLQLVEVADRANVLEPLVLDDGEAGRVIAPVLETFEPVEQKVASRPSSLRIR